MSSGIVMEQLRSGLISTEDRPGRPAGGLMTLFSLAPADCVVADRASDAGRSFGETSIALPGDTAAEWADAGADAEMTATRANAGSKDRRSQRITTNPPFCK
jgi:hypothetical protein